jgi:hypothetical protein
MRPIPGKRRIGAGAARPSPMESAPHGLRIGQIARIELAAFGAQGFAMALATIRIPRARSPVRESEIWRLRAERARRIALMLSRGDAEIALAHAAECEAKAARLNELQRPPIAA